MWILRFFYRLIRFLNKRFYRVFSTNYSYFLMKVNMISLDSKFKSQGIPKLYINRLSIVEIGNDFKINNTTSSNPIGRTSKCLFVVREKSRLIIGNNVGMSGTTIVCTKEIKIGDNVKIGGNVCIYDTDFHSLNHENRKNSISDKLDTKKEKVHISNNVFIGAHSTILKGVSIGENSIIGACSVVTKSVPANEVWGGNPILFIKKLDILDNSGITIP